MRICARRPAEGPRRSAERSRYIVERCGVGRFGRAIALLVVALTIGSCGAGGIFRQYEYEEDIFLSLDGSATIYVNSSIAALDALRGTSFDTAPTARFDRDGIRAYFNTPVTHVSRVSQSRRSGRRFAHVRLEAADVRRLADAPPFAWSTYKFAKDGNLFVYQQTLGAAAGKEVADTGWNGNELVAVRLHVPSKIEYHNTRVENFRRGNILVWEQPLADRLRGVPLAIDARMQTQSILYRTLWLFAATFLAVAVAFAITIWWILGRGKTPAPPAQPVGGA
jgi:hypothetical protein